MAASGEQRTAAGIFPCVPAELSVPRPNPMVIIDFAIMQFAKQSLVDDRFSGHKLTGIATFETDARLYLRLINRFLHRAQIFERKTNWLLDNQMFSSFSSCDDLFRVI